MAQSRSVQLKVSAILLFFIGMASSTFAQELREGDRVMAEVNMTGNPDLNPGYANWKKATIIKIEIWNGQVSGYSIKTDDGNELVIGGKYLKKITEVNNNNNNKDNQINTPPVPKPEPPPADLKFKVGDRVEVDRIMSNDPNTSRWSKATVKAVDLVTGRYVVTLDDFTVINILIRPGKTWIKPLQDGSKAPLQETCNFNEPAGDVTNTTAPSAALFKRVIWEWNNSIKRGSRLGITFEKFEMGNPYRNIITQKGRLLDFIPTNALVYPVKTQQVVCEEYTTLIRRTLLEVEYACYKSGSGEWICKNGSPTKMELKSIYKD